MLMVWLDIRDRIGSKIKFVRAKQVEKVDDSLWSSFDELDLAAMIDDFLQILLGFDVNLTKFSSIQINLNHISGSFIERQVGPFVRFHCPPVVTSVFDIDCILTEINYRCGWLGERRAARHISPELGIELLR